MICNRTNSANFGFTGLNLYKSIKKICSLVDGGGADPGMPGSALPGLQSCRQKTSTMLRMVFLFFQTPFRKRAFFGIFQNKNPLAGVLVFCLISGAGGSRTRVQARRPYAFYMLILP